jgi:ankyrin repeat protein
MSYASPCTGINSIADNINTIQIGNIKLPGGFETTSGILLNMCQYLDIRSFLNFIETSLIKQLTKEFGSDDFKGIINELIQKHPARKLYLLIERYKRDFPEDEDGVPTPIVCACGHGRMDDVELFVSFHPFHKYITNRDVSGYRDDMTLKDMVNQVGKDRYGTETTPLMEAVVDKHFQVVQYLIEQGEADPNIPNRYSYNVLHFAARSNRTNIEFIKLLISHMSLNSINMMNAWEQTPLDEVYFANHSPLRQEIIALLRSKGGKANKHDENGRSVGAGNGDLND